MLPDPSAVRYTTRISKEMRTLWQARNRQTVHNAASDRGGLAADVLNREGLSSAGDRGVPADAANAPLADSPVESPVRDDRIVVEPASKGGHAEALSQADEAQASGAPETTVRLRIDGVRPMRFRGIAILSGETRRDHILPDGSSFSTSQTLDLYLANDGDLVAATSSQPEGCGTARPVFRGLRSRDQDEVAAFIRRHSPGDMFLDPPAAPGQRGLHHTDISLLLGRDFADMFGFAVRGAGASKG